jgi:hypothetical protein
VTVDEATIVPFIVNTVQNVPLAVALSTRANLKGAESLFTGQFQRLFQAGQYKEAAIIAASSPGTVLRNAQTIQLFQQVLLLLLLLLLLILDCANSCWNFCLALVRFCFAVAVGAWSAVAIVAVLWHAAREGQAERCRIDGTRATSARSGS